MLISCWKLFSFLRYLNVCPDIFGHAGKRLRKPRLISKLMTLQTEKQINTIHTLPNTSRNKGKQITKFGQFIDYIKWEILFLKNHTQSVAEKLVPDPFLKKSKLSVPLDQQFEMLYSCFYCIFRLRFTKIYKTKVLTTCFYLI